MKGERHRKDITIRLRTRDVPDALKVVRARKDEARRSSRLRVRVRDDGRLRARVAIGGRYHVRPHLKGRLVVAGRDTSLRGVIYESYAESLMPGLYLGIALFMALITLAILTAGDFRSPGLIICPVAAVLLGLLGHRLGRLRPTSFALDAKELQQAVKRLVQASH
jgi:hypothetical protein